MLVSWWKTLEIIQQRISVTWRSLNVEINFKKTIFILVMFEYIRSQIDHVLALLNQGVKNSKVLMELKEYFFKSMLRWLKSPLPKIIGFFNYIFNLRTFMVVLLHSNSKIWVEKSNWGSKWLVILVGKILSNKKETNIVIKINLLSFSFSYNNYTSKVKENNETLTNLYEKKSFFSWLKFQKYWLDYNYFSL